MHYVIRPSPSSARTARDTTLIFHIRLFSAAAQFDIFTRVRFLHTTLLLLVLSPAAAALVLLADCVLTTTYMVTYIAITPSLVVFFKTFPCV